MRRYDQRNVSDKNSACAALISNISERDRSKDKEQFDDFVRTSINETDKFENRSAQPEIRKSCSQRFPGTTMSHDDLLIDKVATVPTTRNRKVDTSAPMEIGMAAKDDGDNLREGEQ